MCINERLRITNGKYKKRGVEHLTNKVMGYYGTENTVEMTRKDLIQQVSMEKLNIINILYHESLPKLPPLVYEIEYLVMTK